MFIHAIKSLAVTAMFSALAASARADILVKSGEKVAFLGDSITQGGWSSPKGYVKLVVAGLKANDIEIDPVPAGISGHKSNDMLNRLEKDVLSKNPQWMTLSCGVNDVWHGAKGVPLDDYKKNIREIVEGARRQSERPRPHRDGDPREPRLAGKPEARSV